MYFLIVSAGGPIKFTNAIIADNGIGINLVPDISYVENSIIIGQTENLGYPIKTNTRSYPDIAGSKKEYYGWSTYDNGG